LNDLLHVWMAPARDAALSSFMVVDCKNGN
jgi:hypothetical protein